MTNTLMPNSLFKLNEHNLSKQHKDSSLYDTCFHLMKLYCSSQHSMEDLLNPLSHTSNQLDTRLSWHLAQALTSLNYNHSSRLCLDNLNDMYANQLQYIDGDSNDMWHWSIFVLMHTSDEKRRESSVRLYLSKYVSSQSELNERERFLVEKLQVPLSWVYEYKALKAKYKHEHANQFELLLKAHKWNEAHVILVEILAPDLFLKRKNYFYF